MKDKISLAEYYPQIDSVRAIAVLFVLFHHYLSERITSLLPLGSFGVDIFFTLSGFLITGILISYRSIKPVGAAIRKFYFRRILRIFPIYYLYILIAAIIFGHEISRTIILWASVYGLNFYIINHGLLPSYVFAHFWSLAVEEQFYLVWPFLILLFPFRQLRYLIIFAIFISIGFSYYHISRPIMAYHPIACMQALAMG
ncbi:MAG TPA: acyltransferase, partial [Puia sp.]